MIRGFSGVIMIAVCLLGSPLSSVPVDLYALESQYGALQGQMKLGAQTVLVFETVRLKIDEETGRVDAQPISPEPPSSMEVNEPSTSVIRSLKRRIARLPVDEQVRYWKLHQLRYPQSDVTAELEAALDLMDEIRRQTLVAEVKEVKSAQVVYQKVRHTRSSYFPYFPTYGHRSGYHVRRGFKKDSQIELGRPVHRPRPVENWTTAMSLADRGRSEALSKVSGARAEALGRISGARSQPVGPASANR